MGKLNFWRPKVPAADALEVCSRDAGYDKQTVITGLIGLSHMAWRETKMNKTRRVLMVEDEPDYASGVVDYLGHHGIQVTVVTTLAAAMVGLERSLPQALILDQFVDGLDLVPQLPEVRAAYKGPILMLTSNTDVVDRILSLETGANDFILKSISPRELLARLRAAMRPPALQVSAGEPEAVRELQAHPPLSVDGWWMSFQNREIRSPDGVSVVLTGAERDALWFLLENRGGMVTRDELNQVLFRGIPQPDSRGLDNLLSRVRRRVREVGGVLKLENVRGQGYVFYGFDQSDVGAEARRTANDIA